MEERENLKILIAEDQHLLRDSLKSYLDRENGFIISTVSNGKQAVERCDIDPPSIILMDIKMPVMTGLEAAKIIKERNRSIKIVILTLYEDERDILEVIKIGADGYLLKDITPEALIQVIKTVNMGLSVFRQETLIQACSTVHMLKDKDDIEFTPGEQEIIRKICQGKQNKLIAKELNCSLGTVKNRVCTILSKTGLSDRTQIVVYALKRGLIT